LYKGGRNTIFTLKANSVFGTCQYESTEGNYILYNAIIGLLVAIDTLNVGYKFLLTGSRFLIIIVIPLHNIQQLYTNHITNNLLFNIWRLNALCVLQVTSSRYPFVFFFWPLYCVTFKLQHLVTLLVSSIFSYLLFVFLWAKLSCFNQLALSLQMTCCTRRVEHHLIWKSCWTPKTKFPKRHKNLRILLYVSRIKSVDTPFSPFPFSKFSFVTVILPKHLDHCLSFWIFLLTIV
jgi:hypothetical protein